MGLKIKRTFRKKIRFSMKISLQDKSLAKIKLNDIYERIYIAKIKQNVSLEYSLLEVNRVNILGPNNNFNAYNLNKYIDPANSDRIRFPEHRSNNTLETNSGYCSPKTDRYSLIGKVDEISTLYEKKDDEIESKTDLPNYRKNAVIVKRISDSDDIIEVSKLPLVIIEYILFSLRRNGFKVYCYTDTIVIVWDSQICKLTQHRIYNFMKKEFGKYSLMHNRKARKYARKDSLSKCKEIMKLIKNKEIDNPFEYYYYQDDTLFRGSTFDETIMGNKSMYYSKFTKYLKKHLKRKGTYVLYGENHLCIFWGKLAKKKKKERDMKLGRF